MYVIHIWTHKKKMKSACEVCGWSPWSCFCIIQVILTRLWDGMLDKEARGRERIAMMTLGISMQAMVYYRECFIVLVVLCCNERGIDKLARGGYHMVWHADRIPMVTSDTHTCLRCPALWWSTTDAAIVYVNKTSWWQQHVFIFFFFSTLYRCCCRRHRCCCLTIEMCTEYVSFSFIHISPKCCDDFYIFIFLVGILCQRLITNKNITFVQFFANTI